MNGVSDLKLALACAQAGVVPSLVPYSYPDFKQFFLELAEYKRTGDEIIVALRLDEVLNPRLTTMLYTAGITHIELLEYDSSMLTEQNTHTINSLRQQGVKIILKILNHTEIEPYKNIVDAVTIKGPDGAGRSDNIDLLEEVSAIRSLYPTIAIIASGGVKSSADVHKFLNAGASAVGVGTLFALSKESSLSMDVKLKLLNKNSEDIVRLKSGATQRAVVFSETDDDDFNNTNGLLTGLKTGSAGHIFMGNAIDTVTEILSVQEIANHLLV